MYNSTNNIQNKAQKQEELNRQKKYQMLEDFFYWYRGFTTDDPKLLYNFYVGFKKIHDRGIKVHPRIRGLMDDNPKYIGYIIECYIKKPKTYSTGQTMDNTKMFKSEGFGNSTNNRLICKTAKKNLYNTQIVNDHNPKFTEKTLRRLYPRQKKIEEREKQKLNCDDFNSFFERLIDCYYEKNKKDLSKANDPENLIEFWRNLEEKDKKDYKLDWEDGEKDLEDNIDLFFDDNQIIERLSNEFYRMSQFRTYHPTALHDNWEKIDEIKKYYLGLNKYNKDDLFKLLIDNYEKLKSEKKEKEEKKLEEDQKYLKDMEKQRRQKIIETKEEREKKYSQLAIPKDRYKTGRVMLRLKNKFKYDNIIKKMIYYEFKDNRPFKFAEEYAVRDEDEQEDIIFKHEFDKGKKDNFNQKQEKIKNQMLQTYKDYEQQELIERPKKDKIEKENRKLFYFIKKKVKDYYKKMEDRLEKNSIELISNYLNNMYKEMSKKHRNATRRLFKKTHYEVLKKAYKYQKLHIYYPQSLKYLFFQLLRRLGKDERGKLIFAKQDNLSFWGPSLSNNCKVHGNNCPLYCIHNTHNDMLIKQRQNNFKEIFENKKELTQEETFNLWKRPELLKEKEKVFMCFDDAKHCTFEPNLSNKEIGTKTKEELVDSRVNNMKWVGEMGVNLIQKFPIKYKEGICKRARILFADGRYEDTIKELQKAFDLDEVKGHFEPEYLEKIKKKRRLENENNEHDPNAIFKKEENKKKLEIIPDNYQKPKNAEICNEVYFMLKHIEEYHKRQKKNIKKLKEEIDIIEYNKRFANNKPVETKEINLDPKYSEKNPTFAYIKDKYFNFFKTIMCPLKEQCPFLEPRWPHSDKSASTPYGSACPYAHQISELKFGQEISEKIKCRKDLLKKMKKEEDPNIKVEWIPTGPLESCIGCGLIFDDKKRVHGAKHTSGAKGASNGICGFCQYKKRNGIEAENSKKATSKKNETILKKINYEGKPEEIDQDYMAKFGMLKKAIILYGFRRYTDAEKIMANLMEKINVEQKDIDEKYKNLDIKWRKKLEIQDEINPELLNYNIDQNVLNYFKVKIPLATVLVYCDKMRKGNKFSIYNRHTYLNRQIKEFNNLLNKTMSKYDTDVHHLRKQIEDLDLWIKNGKKLKNDQAPKSKKLTRKFTEKYKDHMCKNCEYVTKQKGNSCTKGFRECKDGAHNPNQLNISKPKIDKKLMINNMNNVIAQKKQSTSSTPWSYARQGFIQPGPRFNRSILNQYGKEYRRTKSAKRVKENDIKNQVIRYYEI